MRSSLRTSLFLVSAFAMFTISGCGGGGGGSTPYFFVNAQYNNAGVYSPWPNASIYATATNVTVCTPSPSGCVTSFNSKTGSNGTTPALQTDALPADWQATAYPDSTCSAGASSGFVSVTTGLTIDVLCGQNVTDAVASPNGYFYCPTRVRPQPKSVTITAANPIFKASPLPQVTSYDEQGKVRGSATNVLSVSSNLKQVTIPVTWPLYAAGNYVMVIRDPSTGSPVAASVFTVTVYQPPPGCHVRSCYDC